MTAQTTATAAVETTVQATAETAATVETTVTTEAVATVKTRKPSKKKGSFTFNGVGWINSILAETGICLKEGNRAKLIAHGAHLKIGSPSELKKLKVETLVSRLAAKILAARILAAYEVSAPAVEAAPTNIFDQTAVVQAACEAAAQ